MKRPYEQAARGSSQPPHSQYLAPPPAACMKHKHQVGDAKPAFIALASPPPASDNGTVELLIKPVAGTVSGTAERLGFLMG